MIYKAKRPDKPFDVVVVHSLSRFSRDTLHSELYIRQLNKAGVETMKSIGRLSDSSIQPIASVAAAVAVKAGAPHPDLSTPESFKETLLKARSLCYSHPEAGGASGIYIANANAAGIPMEVLHRVAAMASGGMDTLPHNGAVITLLAVTGLTHRQAYKDIFAITIIKTMAVFVVIGLFYGFGVV